jgi:prepilin-type N-terminal cleavage/methylation domain-containing protein
MSCRSSAPLDARRASDPSRAGRPRAAPAFTLIELLLAIALLSVIVALVYGALFQVTGGAQALTQEFSEDQELRLLVRMISQDLQAVRYLPEFTKKLNNETRPSGLIARSEFVARGDFSRIDFHTAGPARQHRQRPEEGDPLLHEVGYQVLEDRTLDTLTLVRREDYYVDGDMEAGGVTAVLARDIDTFKVECLLPAQAPGQQQEVWTSVWDSRPAPTAPNERLPRALRITLGQTGKSGRHLKEVLEINLEAVLKDVPATAPQGGSGTSQPAQQK